MGSNLIDTDLSRSKGVHKSAETTMNSITNRIAAATAADGNVEQNRSVDLVILRTRMPASETVCPLEGSSIVVIIYT
jgi:hypothetical protein|tara:strand:- start:1978 stop:2208 length:231 start_codon:yes stop_codon:yes gene_type:complete